MKQMRCNTNLMPRKHVVPCSGTLVWDTEMRWNHRAFLLQDGQRKNMSPDVVPDALYLGTNQTPSHTHIKSPLHGVKNICMFALHCPLLFFGFCCTVCTITVRGQPILSSVYPNSMCQGDTPSAVRTQCNYLGIRAALAPIV